MRQKIHLTICCIFVSILLWQSVLAALQNNYRLVLLDSLLTSRHTNDLQSRVGREVYGTACSRSFYLVGIKHFLEGRLIEGQEVLETHTKCQPNDVVAFFWLGKIYQAQGDLSAASTIWNQAKVIDFMLTMASVSIEQGDWRSSQEFYDLAIVIDDMDCRVWAGYGRLLLEQNDNDAALKAFLRAKDLGCREMDIFIEIGDIFRHKQDYDRALYWYRRTAQEYMDEPLPIVLQGVVFYRQADFESAVNSFNYALSIRENMDTYGWLGRSYLRLGQTEESIAAYTKAVEINPRSTKYYLPLGSIYEAEGRFRSAFHLYEQGLSLDPTNEQLYERWMAIGQMKLNQ
jgi:O-antigen biosynthesis protein